MTNKDKAKEFIKTLEDSGFYMECPACGQAAKLSDCRLFYLNSFPDEAQNIIDVLKERQRKRNDGLIARRKSIRFSEIRAQAVNSGFLLQRLAPCMKSFRFQRRDCRPLSDPIDYLIFEGLSTTGIISKIFFMEIKTGGSSLKPVQQQIKSLVQSKKVSVAVYKSRKNYD